MRNTNSLMLTDLTGQTYRLPMQIAFTCDKNGRPIAYRWSRQMRWFRIGLEEARIMIAQGHAIEVRYVPAA